MTLSIFTALLALVAQAAAAPNANGLTALQALKILPKDSWARLARVQAFEGGPVPERWYFLVHDTREENGLHEYVVAKGELVATRAVSQFAEELKAEDIIGNEAVKIDSDRVASIAKQYAEANKLVMATCNYELKKDGEDAVPLWRVTCLDEKGEEIGQISVSASKGTVVRHEGFVIEPTIQDAKAQLAAAEAQYKRDVAAYRAQQQRRAASAAAAAGMGGPRQQQPPYGGFQPPPQDDRQGLFHRIFGRQPVI